MGNLKERYELSKYINFNIDQFFKNKWEYMYIHSKEKHKIKNHYIPDKK